MKIFNFLTVAALSITVAPICAKNFVEGEESPIPVVSYSSKMTAHVFRLKPGQDFIEELTRWAKEKEIKAGAILSVVGSFTHIHLRYADESIGDVIEGPFEIVSIVGTFNDTSRHLHMSVSNAKGETFGGHMLSGNLIYTTAEVVVAELEDLTFSREMDEKSEGGSGWPELVVKPSL
ncbi:MAG: DNA-binding protein [Verrucomicrobia bacterium]|nr:DNA-binding protein [Verrucomicrobiota bacterium]